MGETDDRCCAGFRNHDIYARLSGIDILADFPLTAAWRDACAQRESVRTAFAR